MRRGVEIPIGLIIGIGAFPLFLFAWLLLRPSLGSPSYFSQVRAGLHGVPFKLVKLRTMADECDAAGNLLPDADRVTVASSIIRRLRLDELPQLWLVLKGEMALVGPRPLLPGTIDAFGEAGRRRVSVRPGLTGWAQISGNTQLTDDEKLALDLWYVAHRSTWLDLQILVETLRVAVFGEHRRGDRLARATRELAPLGLEGTGSAAP